MLTPLVDPPLSGRNATPHRTSHTEGAPQTVGDNAAGKGRSAPGVPFEEVVTGLLSGAEPDAPAQPTETAPDVLPEATLDAEESDNPLDIEGGQQGVREDVSPTNTPPAPIGADADHPAQEPPSGTQTDGRQDIPHKTDASPVGETARSVLPINQAEHGTQPAPPVTRLDLLNGREASVVDKTARTLGNISGNTTNAPAGTQNMQPDSVLSSFRKRADHSDALGQMAGKSDPPQPVEERTGIKKPPLDPAATKEAAANTPAPVLTRAANTPFNWHVFQNNLQPGDSLSPEINLDAEVTLRDGLRTQPGSADMAQNARLPAHHRPEMPRLIANQITETIRLAPGEQRIEVILEPRELGRVKLSLTGNDTVMNIAVVAERSETLDLLKRHISMLASDFRDLGYRNPAFSFGQGGEDSQDAHQTDAGSSTSAQLHDDNEPPSPVSTSVTRIASDDRVDIRL